MQENQFIPKTRRTEAAPQAEPEGSSTDNMSQALLRTAQYAVALLLGLVPVFFLPGLWGSLGFAKVLLALGATALVVITISLLMLRRTTADTALPMPLLLFWAVFLASLVSALLSGDAQEAIRGSVLEPQTAGFFGVLALVMTAPLVLQRSKLMSIKALTFFGFTSTILLVYVLLRFIFGADFLSLSSFTSLTASPVGGFNDLAIFAGLLILLGLVTLVQLPLRTWLQAIVAFIIAGSLVVLAVVNFFNVWLIVGFFALLVLIYLLSRDTLFKRSDAAPARTPKILLITTILVCVVGATFVVSGEYMGGKIGQLANVNYVEVRPSVEATMGIAREVYAENALFGIGPNRFADAWRLHKDQSINGTVFWNTDFNAGSGFVPTFFVNAGLLGGVLLIAFHLWFLYLGYRMLLRSSQQDSYWYYFGVASFTAAVFIWIMTYLYVPGTAVLMLGALFSGFTFVAAGALLPSTVRTVPLAINQRRGFLLMAAVIVLISATVAVLFSVGKQYVAEAQFTKAQATAESLPAFEQAALSAFGLYPDDRFVNARAQVQLASLSAIINTPEPTEEDQQRFLGAAEQALVFAEQALTEDPTNPDNHALLAGVYSNLALAGVDGAQERAAAALEQAEALDPQNPTYRLLAAQLAARTGDTETAREEINAALQLKRNYTEALYLSAQLDISEGNTEAAIATTRAITTLEPNNPTRYFQLGVLFSANDDLRPAVQAFETAIALDPAYANARYLLALVYLNLDQPENALEQLRVVQQTNQDNAQLRSLIEQLEAGEAVAAPDLGLDAPVEEIEPGEGFEGEVITDTDVDNDLVAPVNTITNPDEDAEESTAPESTGSSATSSEAERATGSAATE